MKKSLQQILDYADLGYEISFTNIYGKDAVLMRKRYSHPAERALICEQIFDHEHVKNKGRFAHLLNWLYDDIQEQEKTRIYKERLSK
jgi:hypothetical protein